MLYISTLKRQIKWNSFTQLRIEAHVNSNTLWREETVIVSASYNLLPIRLPFWSDYYINLTYFLFYTKFNVKVTVHQMVKKQSYRSPFMWLSITGKGSPFCQRNHCGLPSSSLNFQLFQVAYVLIKMGNSPRPGVWVLERSVDNGETYTPWQYFADSPG